MTRLTIATLAAFACACAVLILIAGSNASERRAEYLDAEAAYYECIESGLTRAECVAGVFGDADTVDSQTVTVRIK